MRHERHEKHQAQSVRRHGGQVLTEVTAVIVASREPPDVLAECLEHVVPTGVRAIVVANGLTAERAMSAVGEYPSVELVRLDVNRGYGAAANVGIERSAPNDVLLMNADAWPLAGGVEALAACLAGRPRAAILGPRLVGRDGTPQPTRFSFPTKWWTGSPAVSSWPDRARPWRGATKSDVQQEGSRFVLVGAVLLLRRAALERVGSFDPSFFIFNEEVDLAWRMWEAGWTCESCADATFVHIGGSATRSQWPAMYLEQVRGHLRFLGKHHGSSVAEEARRYLRRVLRLRALFARGEVADAYREAATWLDGHVPTSGDGQPERTRGSEDRTT
ncbi:MAG: glycosyltransferase family 2 protein [Gaiellaceae bacterium]